MIFNKKIIATLLLISVLVVGLQVITPVAAHDTSNAIDTGNFKQNGKITHYSAEYGIYNNKENKSVLFITFHGTNKKNKFFQENYVLVKTKKNQILSYSLTFDKNNKPNYTLLKVHKTTKNVKNFYTSYYKKYSGKQVKKL